MPHARPVTQEFRLESQLTGALNWQAGVYYFDEDYDTESFTYDSLAGGVQNQYLRANQTNKAWAVFGSVDLRRDADAFELRAGVRYTQDEKDFVTGAPVGIHASRIPSLPTTAHARATTTSAGTWPAPMSVNDDVNLYARVATGFRAASVQPAGAVRQSIGGRTRDQYLVSRSA